MTPEERDHLLVRYLDGNLTPTETDALNGLLKTDAAARASLREMAMQAVLMGDLARERELATPRERARAPRVMASTWSRRILAIAAAVVLLAGATAVWLWRGRAEALTLARMSGAVSWTTEGGQPQRGLQAGATLRGGTLSLEGAASSAQLVFRDGSTIALNGDSELALPGDSPKRLSLRRGALSADVRPQPAGSRMLIRTPMAEVEVLGTRFYVSVQPGETAVSVEVGRVRMRRLADESLVDVAQGQTAVATLDVAKRMEVRPLPPAPVRWRQAFKKPPSAIWQGEWVRADGIDPGRLRNVPDLSERRADGTPIAAYTVNVRDNSGSIASVRPDSVLCVRFRIQGKHDMLALVGLHRPTGGFAGNFQTVIKPGVGSADASGWRTWEAPLSALEAKFPNCPQIPRGARVFLVYLACYAPDARLEVAEVSIQTPVP
jgi:ferric-dicitrate binding protein FerR (iron transport regulator)